MQNVIGFFCLFVIVLFIVGMCSPSENSSSHRADETYRLVMAHGNSENIVAKGLSRSECEARKRQLKATGEALGTYSESRGIGSITCLPESLF
ncbi:hypothetical protein ACSHT0_04005 [Tepidicaulis sp. LMO-SS28]|uniref:hypothetical protein n=1 Tax=Tepidicaulis sp. LMO-SS28 TaxID=3447455 RepID=UPI003EE09051